MTKHSPAAQLAAIQAVVAAQAEDSGLWFIAQTAAEGYLQQELRKLHKIVEHSMETDVTRIWVCQGPPRCSLTGASAVAAQKAGCSFCRVILVDEYGNEAIKEPGNA